MEKTLKACPFCGGKAELKQAHYLESELPYSYVRCTHEECSMHNNTAHFSGNSEQKNSQNAVTAWNQRQDVPAMHD